MNSTPFSGQNYVKERGIFMARYNKEFKLHIQCLLENKPFPVVDGIKPRSLRDYTTFWLRLTMMSHSYSKTS